MNSTNRWGDVIGVQCQALNTWLPGVSFAPLEIAISNVGFNFPFPYPGQIVSLIVCFLLTLSQLVSLEDLCTMITSTATPINWILPSTGSGSSGGSIKKPIKTVSKPCFGCDCGDEECDCCICTVM